MLHANAALVRLNGYEREEDLLSGVNDIGQEWYVDPQRRSQFQALLERDGQVVDFVSEVYWHQTRVRGWIRENAHVVRDSGGKVQFYEGTIEDITAAYLAHEALDRKSVV